LATPAYSVVELDVKRAIVGVVLDNLGVTADDVFITSVAQELDSTELDGGLVTAVTDLLDAGTDPRTVIESQTDQDGDGVPDEGAALAVDDEAPNPNSTEKSGNSDDKKSNSDNRNPNGTKNSNSGSDDSDDDEDESESDDDESDEDNSDEDEDEERDD
ncbi:MAG: hypothetical protein ACKOWP_00745, partial [Microbacteriaceae bacterium]